MLWSLSVFNLIFNNLGSTLLLLLFFNLIKNIYSNIKSRKRLPSGPIGLPIVGYLPFLGKSPHKDIAKLGEKYGNIFTLQMGIHNVVVLNDWESVRDAFHKDAFLGRPDYSPFTIASGNKSFVDENGSVWREHRRFALQLLRDLGFGKGSMEDHIILEISYLIQEIDKSNGEAFNIHTVLTPSMSNNICALVFGHRLEYNDPQRALLDQILDSASKLFSQIGILALSPPWFGKLILSIGALGNKTRFKTIFNLFQGEIDNHIKTLNEKNIRDYIDGYLVEIETRKKKDPNTSITMNKLHGNCRAFFGAGSETVRTTTEWNLLIAAGYSKYQQKIHEEIDSVIGKDRSPSWDDRLLMPFTQAFLSEVFRWKTILPLNLMRRSLEDSSILGHFIPKNTYILANFWAVHNDPKTWENPHIFNPNRFLSDDGKELIKHEALIPFSVGKRSCVGETLARVEVFLYFTSILQRYRVSSPNNKILTFEDQFGLTLQPKEGVILRFQKRF